MASLSCINAWTGAQTCLLRLCTLAQQEALQAPCKDMLSAVPDIADLFSLQQLLCLGIDSS